MTDTIIAMYVTLMPAILAGILNMVWCKLKILKFLQKPIDFNRNFVDGKRIFGDNKTWKGILGYILMNIFTCILWGRVCACSAALTGYNFFYVHNENTLQFNLELGLLLGLGYSLFELPNSFLKRRFDIEPGKTSKGIKKVFFILLDQADSVFGCALVVWIFYDLGIVNYLLYVVIGAATHIVINMLLYFAKLRKNML